MASTSQHHANDILDRDYGAATWGGTIYAALAVTLPDLTGDGTVVAPVGGQYDTYAEVALTDNATTFPAAVNGIKTTGVDFHFPIPGGGSTAGTPLTHLVFRTAAGGGRILDAVPLPTGTAVVIGMGLYFPAGSVRIVES